MIKTVIVTFSLYISIFKLLVSLITLSSVPSTPSYILSYPSSVPTISSTCFWHSDKPKIVLTSVVFKSSHTLIIKLVTAFRIFTSETCFATNVVVKSVIFRGVYSGWDVRSKHGRRKRTSGTGTRCSLYIELSYYVAHIVTDSCLFLRGWFWVLYVAFLWRSLLIVGIFWSESHFFLF